MLGLLSALLLAAPDASPGEPPANLLRSASVFRSTGAPNVVRMSDGKAPIDGDNWDSPHTAVLAANGEVIWDLSSLRHIGALRLQADNNDTYTVSASTDGEHFTPAWVAKPVGVPGMQTRTSEPLEISARYLRITAQGGDNLFSIGEFEAFDSPSGLRSIVERIVPPPPPPPPPINSGLLVVLAVAGYGAWLLNDARRTNQARAAASAPHPEKGPETPAPEVKK